MNLADRFRQWRKGVWSCGPGSFAVYTDDHYLVVSADPDGSNVYCGRAEVRYTDDGIETRQTVRVRQRPDGELVTLVESEVTPAQPTLHRVAEVGEDFILFDSCGGDRFRLQADGTETYMPAEGPEVVWRRIEML
jgi:hypothetical protein